MTTSSTIVVLALAASAAGGLVGCAAPHPVIRQGDADSVEILYGGDWASTLPLARDHCSRYERVPRLRNSGADLAVFNCVPR